MSTSPLRAIAPLLAAAFLGLILPPDAARGAESLREFRTAAAKAFERGEWKEAAAAYARAAELCPTLECRGDAENKAGFSCLRDRDWPRALTHFEQAASLEPENKVILNNLGICNLTLYQAGISGTSALDSAIRAFEAVSRIDADYRPANLAQARSLAELADRARAHWGFDVQKFDPEGNYAFFKAQGISAEKEANFILARLSYERAETLASTPSRKSAVANMLGLLELKTRRPKLAREHFERAAKLNPHSKYAWNNLGVTLLRIYEFGLGDKELIQQAVSALKRLAEIDPSYRRENLERAESMLMELMPSAPAQTPIEESQERTAENAPDTEQSRKKD